MRWLLFSLLTLAATVTLAAENTVVVKLQDLEHYRVAVPGHEGHDGVRQHASLSTGAVTYGLQYTACWDKAHDNGTGYTEGYLGMPEPSSANWYHGGFLGLKINGVDLGATKLTQMWVAESGPRGNLKLFWDTPQAGVTVAFVALPGDDRLFCALTLNPKTEIKSLSLRLMSYPSFFTYHHKRAGDRKLATATETYPQAEGKPVTLDPARQCWLALYDTIFDPAKGEGDGGAAVAFLPEQVAAAKATVGSYGCPVELEVKPQTRVVRLCFWDFNRRGNEDSLSALRAGMAATLKTLREMDFAPVALTGFATGAKLAVAKEALAKVNGSAELIAKLETAAAEVTALQETVREGLSPTPAAAEKSLQEKLTTFEGLLWSARFFVLING